MSLEKRRLNRLDSINASLRPDANLRTRLPMLSRKRTQTKSSAFATTEANVDCGGRARARNWEQDDASCHVLVTCTGDGQEWQRRQSESEERSEQRLSVGGNSNFSSTARVRWAWSGREWVGANGHIDQVVRSPRSFSHLCSDLPAYL